MTLHYLANDFLKSDQGFYNPRKQVIDPPSSEIRDATTHHIQVEPVCVYTVHQAAGELYPGTNYLHGV
jgi:hypothetical protein